MTLTRTPETRGLGAGFRQLFIAATVTRFADSSRMAAFGLLAATLTTDPHLVSAVAAMAFLPWVFFGLAAGAFVDRRDKRRAFFVADLLRCAITALLAVVVAVDQVTIAIVLLAAFLLTSLQTVSDSCFNSLLPAVVDRESLSQANARLSMAQSGVGQFAGGPAGSVLFSWRPAVPFVGNALCFLAAAAAIWRLPRAEQPPPSPVRTSLRQDITAGLRWIAATRLIRTLTTCVAVMNFASGLYQGVLPLYALHTLHMRPAAYGAFAGTTAVAMIGGNYLAGRLSARVQPTLISRVAVSVQVLAFLVLACAPTAWVALAGVAVYGFTAGMWNVPGMTILMSETPDEMRGRVMAAYRTLAVGVFPVGAVLSGLVAGVAGNRAPLAVGACCVAAAAYGLIRALRHSGRPAGDRPTSEGADVDQEAG